MPTETAPSELLARPALNCLFSLTPLSFLKAASCAVPPKTLPPATLSLPNATEFGTVALADEPIATASAAVPTAPLPIAIDACAEALALLPTAIP